MKPFHFRHFSIQQSQAAMKVGTDSMLLGSLCNFDNARSVLDIGTGTGVLSLMIAQRFAPAHITAIEIDEAAAADAQINFSDHPFSSEIELIRIDIRQFHTDKLFDGIITNPPFFENSSQSMLEDRNLARHTTTLSFSDLFSVSARLLVSEGKLWMILPADVTRQITAIALENGFHFRTLINVEGKPGKPVRTIMEFGKAAKEPAISSFIVRTADGSYTNEYIALTKEFHGVDLSAKK